MKRFLIACLCLIAFAAVAQPTASIGLQWSPNTESDLKGYRLYRGTASRQYDWSQDVGLATTVRAEGLVPGVTYYFAVTAWNTSNLESDQSNEVSYTVPGGDPVSAITGWEMERKPDTVATKWDAAPAGEGVARWRVRYGLVGSADLTETWVTTPEFGFPAHNPWVAYTVKIAAEGIQGVGPERSFTVPGFPRLPSTVSVIEGSVIYTFPPVDVTP